jgi:hypothetical protein
MSTTPLSDDSENMPSESTFRQHADIVRAALAVFNVIKNVDAPKAVKGAFDDLVCSAADFQRFAPFFDTHVLFQELVPATHLSLDAFLSKHPGFEVHALYPKIALLNTRIKEAVQTPVKKGREFFLEIPFAYLTLFSYF